MANRNKPISVNLSAEERDRVRRAAAALGVPMSVFARAALHRHIERLVKKEGPEVLGQTANEATREVLVDGEGLARAER